MTFYSVSVLLCFHIHLYFLSELPQSEWIVSRNRKRSEKRKKLARDYENKELNLLTAT